MDEFNGKIVVFDHNKRLPPFIKRAEERQNFRYVGIAHRQEYDTVQVNWISDNPANIGPYVHIKYLRVVPNWVLRNGLCTSHFMHTILALESVDGRKGGRDIVTGCA